MGLNTLGYRPWQGTLRGAWLSPWPISKIALQMVFRRKLFWLLYALGLGNFLFFFSGIYLFNQIDIPSLAGTNPRAIEFWQNMLRGIQESLYLAGTKETYRNFIWFQGYVVMAVLAFAGAILIGNDYQYGTLPFYLSKPLGRWHYVAGKFLAVAVFVCMLTVIPGLVLFGECIAMEGWNYVSREYQVLWGIFGYGAVISVCLGLVVLALASWLRKTVPLLMVWLTLLAFAPLVAFTLVDQFDYDVRWRLIDLWNNMYLLGAWCFGASAPQQSGREMVARAQPEVWEAALVLLLVCAACLMYLDRRIRAVEIVR